MSDRHLTPSRQATAGLTMSDLDGFASLRERQERTLIDQLLADQQSLTAVERFSALHERGSVKERYSALLPTRAPGAGEQYRFEVNLDACTGCKACVAACHSLNGLDDDEAWRDVGMIVADGYQQTVTTACHHCADPACANGCPVRAYEKDATTGIVKHLDDQCIGCQYCMLKCPYEVPKYNERLGIVRKCDMCSQRLAVGEAPACVQACPTSAISIRLVRTETMTAALVPGAFDERYTQPTTRYVSAHPIPVAAQAADRQVLRVQHTHVPLIVMLVLTQLSAGWFCAASVSSHTAGPLVIAATVALFAGLTASVFHLGRPLGAWRFFLGLRRSWMSREILVFSLLAAIAPWVVAGVCDPGLKGLGYLIHFVGSFSPTWSRAPAAAALLALVAVFTSAMIYIDTHRSWWTASRTLTSFFGTVVKLGASGSAALLAHAHDVRGFTAAALSAGAVLWFVEPALAGQHPLSRRIVREKLRGWHPVQRALALTAMCCQATGLFNPHVTPWLAPIAFASSLIACTCERVLFFKAVDAPKMPGGLTA